MRLVVDLNRCQGYAQCAFLAPDVFAMHGDESLLYNPEAAAEQRENVARAVAACPVGAILVEYTDEDLEAVTGAAAHSGGAR
ncbi:ferredoxin [Streptomyces sp. NBC_01408]|uniref:ferredoxin n=1 Tax=Streptomyces sp. NBC_01408 TaxID=2903855 RepID=UPI00224DB1DB|nr:ferredoxin [Streptomyces sp. NBC_01408]MCX4696768.1 ferredoxin [Streptomyces sp. NBC_01408]